MVSFRFIDSISLRFWIWLQQEVQLGYNGRVWVRIMFLLQFGMGKINGYGLKLVDSIRLSVKMRHKSVQTVVLLLELQFWFNVRVSVRWWFKVMVRFG